MTSSASGNAVKVLLVEDNAREARLILEMLTGARKTAFEVRQVPRFADAVDHLRSERPHVVLLDLRLPDRQGLSMVEELRSLAPTTPMIVLTNLRDETTAIQAVRTGAQDYLIKRDVDSNVLTRAIRYAIERERAEEALRQSEERYALAVAGANDGLWDWQIAKGTIYFSSRWKAMLGFEDDEIGDDVAEWLQRVHPADAPGLQRALAEHLESGSEHFQHEHRIETKSGDYVWVLSRGLALRDDKGRAYRMAGSMTDITARKIAEEQLLHDAMHDHLTGLPNRSLFMDRLGAMLSKRRRAEGKPFAVLFFDLDRFKDINDSLGHGAGDELLVQIASRLQGFVRPQDTLARVGGDEFSVLVTDIGNIRHANQVSERLHTLLSEDFEVRGRDVSISASIGVAIGPGEYDRPEEMLRDADLAMYRAKSLGRARYAVFDREIYRNAITDQRLETDLKKALEADEFQVYYQPIVSLNDGEIVGLEGLVRWSHPEFGLLEPLQFIPIAEESDLVLELSWHVLRNACSQMSDWRTRLPQTRSLYISVNVPGKFFVQFGMTSRTLEILEESHLPPDSLRLEITERAVMHHREPVLSRLGELRECGVQMSLDDFGTGYSSLAYLQRFSYDVIKIDRSFVSNMERSDEGRVIVNTLATLGKSLGMTVVAEGVETVRLAEQLKKMGCPQAQGFWYSKPLEPGHMEQLLLSVPSKERKSG